MSIGRIDLNLLKVFDAVFEDRNLQLAGKRLNLTQSAVSHALSRLRDALGDELFIRTGKGMVPTGRALAIAPDLRDALRRIEITLGVEPFFPETSKRQFVIAANDHLTAVIAAPLSRAVREVAPGVDLVIRPSTRLDLAERIDLGRIHLAIGIFSQVPRRMNAHMLFSEDEALLMRNGHPASQNGLSIAELAKYPLVTLSAGGQEEGAIGGFIVERGLARLSEMFDRQALEEAFMNVNEQPRFSVTLPHALAIPAMLRDTDMVSVVPATLAVALAKDGDLLHRPLPYPSRISSIRSVWHRRDDHDASHSWLRARVDDIARTIEARLV